MSASLAVQGAVNTTLRAASAVTALVSTRIYDEVPQNVTFPFIEFGDSQEIDDGHDCGDGAVEVFLDIHIWSRSSGQVQAKTIAGAVKNALHMTSPSLSSGWRCVEIMIQDARAVPDPDARTSHIVMTCRAMVDPT
jgi:hypothetical protein